MLQKIEYKKINYGIAIKAKSGKAVKRNRIKRLIKENYRLNEEKCGIGNNIVFLVKKNMKINNISFKDIEIDMIHIFEMMR